MAENKLKTLTEYYVALARKGADAKAGPDSGRCRQLIADLQWQWIKHGAKLTELHIVRTVDMHVRAMDLTFAVQIGFKTYDKKEFDAASKKKIDRQNKAILFSYDLLPKNLDGNNTSAIIDKGIKLEGESNVIRGINFRQKKPSLPTGEDDS